MPSKLQSKLLPLLLLSSLTACAKDTTGTVTVRTVHDFCLLAGPITYSERHGADQESVDNKYDSDITVAQVKTHDLKYDALCPSSDASK